MTIITRREFIKSIGLCILLIAIGEIKDGLSFFPNDLSTGNQLTESNFWTKFPNYTYPSNIRQIYICVGESGLKVGKALLARMQKLDTPVSNPIPIRPFDPKNSELNGFIANAHAVFLVGSIKDKEFWAARELILSHPRFLLYTIIVAEQNSKLLAKSFKVHENEGCVFVQGKNYPYMAALNAFSLFSTLMMPGIVGYDAADHKSAMSGKSGYMVHTESTFQDSIEAFKKTISFYKQDIRTAGSILFHLMYNEAINYNLDHMTAFSDIVYENISDDTDFLWNCTEEPHNLGVEFRASMFIPLS